MNRRDTLILIALAIIAIVIWRLRREKQTYRVRGYGRFLRPSSGKHQHWRAYFDGLAEEGANGRPY